MSCALAAFATLHPEDPVVVRQRSNQVRLRIAIHVANAGRRRACREEIVDQVEDVRDVRAPDPVRVRGADRRGAAREEEVDEVEDVGDADDSVLIGAGDGTFGAPTVFVGAGLPAGIAPWGALAFLGLVGFWFTRQTPMRSWVAPRELRGPVHIFPSPRRGEVAQLAASAASEAGRGGSTPRGQSPLSNCG